MHPHHPGHLRHGHGGKRRYPFLEKSPLPHGDLAGDGQDRLLTLLDALDQELASPDFVAQVTPHLGHPRSFTQQIAVSPADAEPGDAVAHQGNYKIFADLFDDHIRRENLSLFPAEGAARLGVQCGNESSGLANGFLGHSQCRGDLGKFLAGEQIQIAGHHPDRRPAIPAAPRELQSKALGQITRPDARRVKRVQPMEHLNHLGRFRARFVGHFLGRGRQIAVLVQVSH